MDCWATQFLQVPQSPSWLSLSQWRNRPQVKGPSNVLIWAVFRSCSHSARHSPGEHSQEQHHNAAEQRWLPHSSHDAHCVHDLHKVDPCHQFLENRYSHKKSDYNLQAAVELVRWAVVEWNHGRRSRNQGVISSRRDWGKVRGSDQPERILTMRRRSRLIVWRWMVP